MVGSTWTRQVEVDQTKRSQFGLPFPSFPLLLDSCNTQ